MTIANAAHRAVLDSKQQARADALFDELLDQPEAERNARLAAGCADDPAVRAEVQSLLEAAAACGDFLSRPAEPAPGPVEPRDDEAGLRIGAWRIVRDIGHGGMGDVYEAERVEGGFTQRAAIKLLRPEASEQLERFHAERRILARLSHPGIATLYDGGVTADGRPYMAMEFVAGQTLTAHAEAIHATLGERLRLFNQVCEAVAYAHHHLVVHRDLKPGNILVGADGRVKLLDFGIAKLIDDASDDATATRTGEALLTPIYAAPEQLIGGAMTTATDVYALGVLLFELLAGTLPWPREAQTPAAQMRRAMQAKPAPPLSQAAASNPQAPVAPKLLRGDLDAIVAKALRSDPAHRYSTVDALKRDLEHAASGEPVTAREGARLYAAGRLLRRYRWAAASAGAVFVALAVGLGTAAWQAQRAAQERDAARRDAAREEALRYQITGLFRNAIAEHGSEAPTAKTMLDKSAQRVLRQYRDQPKLAGQVVLTLAGLYEALEDVQGAAALLEGFLAQAGENDDPVALADARQKLAGIELMRGHADNSGRLLDQAEAWWASESVPHTEERLEGMLVRARWQRAQGDLTGSITTLRRAIALRIAFSGHDHRETATLYNTLAITLTSANRLDEALAAYRETVAIYDKLGASDRLDAQVIRGNMGTLAMRTGHLHEAESLLQGAIEQQRATGGDSAAVAAALGYYGRLLLITGRAAQAADKLAEAVTIATRYAGASSPVALQARIFLGEAQLARGDRAAARSTLQAAAENAAAQYGAKHALALRSQLALSAVDLADGQTSAALARLAPVITTLRAGGAATEALLAQSLVAEGEAQLAAHDAKAAALALREAQQLRSGFGDTNWELALARERLGEALEADGANDEGRALLAQAESTLTAQLGADHAETQRARRAIDARRQPASASAGAGGLPPNSR